MTNDKKITLHIFIHLSLFFYFIICQSLPDSDSSGMSKNDDNVLHDYPCIEVTKVVETFKPSDFLVYNVTIVPSEFEDFPELVKLKVRFDALANITMTYRPTSFYSDSYSFESTTIDSMKQNLTIIVQPLYVGGSIPNLVGATVNGKELCNKGVKKGLWDDYIRIESTISASKTTTERVKTNILRKIDSSFATEGDDLICGRRPIQHEGLIVRGVTSKPDDWPWHTTLYRLNINNYQPEYICGGTLLSKTKVLTAGHCVIENGAVLLAQRMLAYFGKNNFFGDDIGLQEKNIFQILVHWQFQRTNLTNDLAVLILATEVTFTDYVQPICLYDATDTYREKLFGKIGYVVGWGATEYTKFSQKLQHATMLVKSDLQCILANRGFYSRFLSDTTYCAGFGNGTNVCSGDSGGGMFFPKKDADGQETWYIRGIVSLGVSKRDETVCDPDLYTIFTDVAQYVDGIKEII